MAAGSETSTARALNELDGTLYMYEYDLSTVIEVQYLINCLNLINGKLIIDKTTINGLIYNNKCLFHRSCSTGFILMD